jgi:hypothetical protein
MSPRDVMPDLGFSFAAWNGQNNDDKQASLSISCGSYCTVAALRWPNRVVLSLPSEWTLADLPKCENILREGASIFQPDFGYVTTHTLWEAFRSPVATYLGYVTYLRAPREELTAILPLGLVRSTSIEEGTIISLREPTGTERDYKVLKELSELLQSKKFLATK